MTTEFASDRLHIGCGDYRLEGFVNVDARQTSATDIVHSCADLSFLPAAIFSTVYSHAFFEHLYIFQREACLRSVHRVLKDDGTVVFLGFPDFKRVALAYLNDELGIVSPNFDLRDVYRYSHGQPEHASDWWLEQLHKSLFDVETVELLLKAAGFAHYCVFNYCFRDEKIPLNLGFIGYKSRPDLDKIERDYVAAFLKDYTEDVNGDTIEVAAVYLEDEDEGGFVFTLPDTNM